MQIKNSRCTTDNKASALRTGELFYERRSKLESSSIIKSLIREKENYEIIRDIELRANYPECAYKNVPRGKLKTKGRSRIDNGTTRIPNN